MFTLIVEKKKYLTKFSPSILINTPTQLIEWNFPTLIKAFIKKKPIANIRCKRLNVFPLTDQKQNNDGHTHHYLFNIQYN